MCSFFDYSCGIADTAFAAEVDVTGAVNDRGASTRTVSPEQFGDSPRKARNGRRQLPYRLAHLISRRAIISRSSAAMPLTMEAMFTGRKTYPCCNYSSHCLEESYELAISVPRSFTVTASSEQCCILVVSSRNAKRCQHFLMLLEGLEGHQKKGSM